MGIDLRLTSTTLYEMVQLVLDAQLLKRLDSSQVGPDGRHPLLVVDGIPFDAIAPPAVFGFVTPDARLEPAYQILEGTVFKAICLVVCHLKWAMLLG